MRELFNLFSNLLKKFSTHFKFSDFSKFPQAFSKNNSLYFF